MKLEDSISKALTIWSLMWVIGGWLLDSPALLLVGSMLGFIGSGWWLRRAMRR
jgi:hypothetical protein